MLTTKEFKSIHKTKMYIFQKCSYNNKIIELYDLQIHKI